MTAAPADTPRPWPVEECRTCKKRIIWTQTERGKRMPVDADPTGDGNVALRWHADSTTVLSSIPQPHLAFGRRDLRKSHFAQCPQADKWRRRR